MTLQFGYHSSEHRSIGSRTIGWLNMNVRFRRKKLQRKATDFLKRLSRRVEETSAEARTHSRLGARVADVEKRALGTILHPFKGARDRATDAITERVANKLIDKGLVEVDRAAAQAVQRTVAVIALGLRFSFRVCFACFCCSFLPLSFLPPLSPIILFSFESESSNVPRCRRTRGEVYTNDLPPMIVPVF